MELFNVTLDTPDLRPDAGSFIQAVPTSQDLRALQPRSFIDGLALFIFLLTSLGYVTKGRLWDKPDPHYYVYFEKPQAAKGSSNDKANSTRDISQWLKEGGHDCVIFWGSQSGTAERFAEALGRECVACFGINALVADLSDYDAESIASIRKDHFAIFLLSTYGEGDPSDNAAGFWDWLKHFGDRSVKLGNLRYAAFGLGNSNYKYYNHVLNVAFHAFNTAEAVSLMPPQQADDANGGTEEDLQSWKDDLFALFRSLGYEQKSVVYQASIDVEFTAEPIGNCTTITSPSHHPSNTNSAVQPLTVKNARELFAKGDRNCVHMELDLGTSGLGYKTGDHIAVWPVNPDDEVDRLIHVLGLQSRRNESFTVKPNSETTKPKLPSLTTLATAFRHHLDICGSVARKIVLEVAQFAPTPQAKATLLEFGQNRHRYEQLTSNTHITLARLLHLACPTESWCNVPISFVIEKLLPLQPRYYSISSSSVVSPRTIAITALVVNKTLPGEPASIVRGLTSNYLLSTSKLLAATAAGTALNRCIDTETLQGAKILAHIRKSKFKLPIASSTPLILVSAGTGFAPFRAFLQERARVHMIGKDIGKILLFFGCRNNDDFIYRKEVEKIQTQLDNKLEVVTAFSRAGGKKWYVQDRIGEHALRVLEMLEAGANMYICGKASMAREVDAKLETVVGSTKGIGEQEVKAWTQALKKRGKWKADVWG
ncbi:cytochrome P450 reductase 2 [Ophiobolus disseminans]|uniref:NADPH--cytochrome P450 reductase n=1 Tax=Ophiobolus disseminans TaxID=1469910 RepID=A0A6A7A367_9PLEO|nr:cytochrome P450 reductase 2 [Ophiobolus disseminans]